MNLLKLMAHMREESELTQLADGLAERTVPRIWDRLSDSVNNMGKNEARGYIRVRSQGVLLEEAEEFLAGARLSPSEYEKVLVQASDMMIERVQFAMTKSVLPMHGNQQAKITRHAA